LALVSYGLSLGLITLAGKYSLHLSWMDAMLIAAALACTSGSVVLPALQQINTPESVKITLTMESALGEILAVLMVGSMVGLAGDESLLTGLATGFTRSILIAAAMGVVAGLGWSRFWPTLTRLAYGNVLNLGVVLGLYSLSRYLGGSGLLTTLVFGVTLANVPHTPHMVRQGLRMMAFHAELTFLVRSFFFVLLGIVAQFISRAYILPILGIVAGLLLARYLAVQASKWAVHDATAKNKDLLFWMLPRGLVTAVLALEIVNVRGAAFAFLPALAFTVVLVTNAFVVWGAVRAGSTMVTEQPLSPAAAPLAMEGLKAKAAGVED
jgi:cell volume regulation protein A